MRLMSLIVPSFSASNRWRKWLSRTQTVTRVTAKVVSRWNHMLLLSALGRLRHVGLLRAIEAAIYYIPQV
jgi:hypothetical protein